MSSGVAWHRSARFWVVLVVCLAVFVGGYVLGELVSDWFRYIGIGVGVFIGGGPGAKWVRRDPKLGLPESR